MRGTRIAALLAAILWCSSGWAGSPVPVTPAAQPPPTCDRDVDADLVTIEDRLAKGRLDAARAYADGLLACPEGRADPRVQLALATIDERIGALNDAAEALARAQVLDGADGAHHAAIQQANDTFQLRWVALELAADEAVSTPDRLESAGLVVDAATEACLAELDEAIQLSTGMELPRTIWIVPGLYRLRGETVELAGGDRAVLRLPTPSSAPEGGGT